ncbi:MAG: flagellar filament capping protein FliD [Sedimentisphaerales bacterium]|nr:flagellar filament capping protein FliD [Sedimentisphaerales bacterium]
MGTISSGTGLISGLDIQSLVTQLMEIERRPVTLLNDRIEEMTQKQTALMTVQARIMAIQVAAANFNKQSVFQQKSVISTNEDVLTATGNKYALPGNYTFRVKQLASNHHFVSRSYTSMDSRVGAGVISMEMGNGQVARPTELSFINGQMGFQRGKISITDRNGGNAVIDLSMALTLDEVIKAINDSTSIQVTARVAGDHIELTDTSGGTGEFAVADVGLGQTATNLGIAATVAGTSIIGQDINYITTDTRIGYLNDGNGVRGIGSGTDLVFTRSGETDSLFSVDFRKSMYELVGEDTAGKSTTLASLNGGNGVRLGKFKITDQNGHFVQIDLEDLATRLEAQGISRERMTLGHVKQEIADKIAAYNDTNDPQSADMDVTFSFNSSYRITLTDNSKGSADDNGVRSSHFIIEDLDGGSAATDMGIVDDVAGQSIYGETVWTMSSLGDMVNAINNHWDNWDETIAGDDKRIVIAEIDSTTNALKLTYQGTGSLVVENTDTADDLGIATDLVGFTGTMDGRRLIGGLNSVMLRSLKGGSGNETDRILTGGVITINDGTNTFNVDLTNAFSLQDVINGINDAAAANGSTAQIKLNAIGNGLTLTNVASVSDQSGTLAAQLGLAGDATNGAIATGNMQLQYVSGATLLDDLRNGLGITGGKFRINDADGRAITVNLNNSAIQTVDDVLDIINNATYQAPNPNYDPDDPDSGEPMISQSFTIRAKINDTGDGIMLYDVDPVTGQSREFSVTNLEGAGAKEFGLLGDAELNETTGLYELAGSEEFKLEVGGGDTLQDLADRVNAAGIGITASIINSGTAAEPAYRLSFNSEVSGKAGIVYFDGGTTGMTIQTLSQGRDAIVLYGGQDDSEASPLLISSSSNTLTDVIKGTTLELHSASSEAVSITVDQDLDAIIAQIENFVEAYNTAIEEIDKVDYYNTDTQERSILFGDTAISTVRNTMASMVQRKVPGVSNSLSWLFQVGLKFQALGSEASTENGKTVSYAVAKSPKLTFDEDAFRDAYAADPEGVEEMFTKTTVGVGDYIADRLEKLASTTFSSTMKNRVEGMNTQVKLYQDRIEGLENLLARKETRLYNQFYAMETALAQLQSQQSAISQLSSIAASTKK